MFTKISKFNLGHSRILPIRIPCYCFSQSENNPNKNLRDSDKKFVDALEKNENLRKIRDHLVKELTVIQNNSQKEKSTKELRDSILFDEILRKEVNIPIYDASGMLFWTQYFKNLILFIFGLGMGLYYYLGYSDRVKPERRWLYVVPAFLFAFGRIKYYRDFQRFFVEKIIYNTNNKSFTMTRRNFIGTSNVQIIPKHELLYSDSPELNKRKINYINMKTLDLYSIGYKYAWNNQALFSHLLSQRINSL